jgi:hypothetical protein
MAESIFARNGANVRMVNRENEPALFSIQDVIMFLRNITNNAARKVHLRLIKDHPDLCSKIVSMRIGTNSKPTPMATVANLQHFIVKLKCAAGEALLASMSETHARVLGGDLTIAEEVRTNREEQQRLAATGDQGPMRAFGEYVEKTRNVAPAIDDEFDHVEWREERASQKQCSKTLVQNMKAVNMGGPRITTTIDNALNQAVIGFTENTTAFKRKHCIRDSYPLPNWMDRTQLNLRAIGANKIDALMQQRAVNTYEGVRSVTTEVADRLSEFAAFMNVQGFRNQAYDQRASQQEADERQQAKRICA